MRTATNKRITKETSLSGMLNLDGTGQATINTGIGFFDHMLTLLAFHADIDLQIEAHGDLHVDDHHTIEDIGIMMGVMIKEALGDKMGITRYGGFRMPMDETLTCVDLDISGRPYLVFNADFNREMIKDYSLEMTKEFLYALAINSGITLHVNVLYGDNDHHKVESIFKALGHALAIAVKVNGNKLPSTKGFIQ